jgi:superfamily I DNA/RNA helicase
MSSIFATLAAPKITWTQQQIAVFEAIKVLPAGGGLAVMARAGTGKTTLLTNSFPYTYRDGEVGTAVFLAFGSRNAKELDQRTPKHVRGRTFHSVAGELVPGELKFGKKYEIAKQIQGLHYKLRHPAVQLAGLAQNLAVGLPDGIPDMLDTWVEMIGEFGIKHKRTFTPQQVARAGQEVFRRSNADTQYVDFDDQIYRLARDGAGMGWRPVDWIYVDEAQDTNLTQMICLDKLRSPHTRVVFVGDPSQAIYGWRGAGVGAFQMMVERYNAQVLPLTRTQRCPRAVVACAQHLVPDLEARPDAPEGTVDEIAFAEWTAKIAKPGDAVLCRNNAPLLGFALECIKLNVTVFLAGKDLGKKILSNYDGLFHRDKRDPNVGREVFKDAEESARKDLFDRPFTLAMALDELQAAAYVWEILWLRRSAEPWKHYDDFHDCAQKLINSIFFDPDDKTNGKGIILSTIHRAKGMEWDRVFFLLPELIPSKAARALGGWHLEQEANLDYVARTRAKSHLTFVRGRPDAADVSP